MKIDISLITSIYRAEKFLPDYFESVQSVVSSLADYAIELIIVANDATATERQLIDGFAQMLDHVVPLYVGRETLYASWNRGVTAASGVVIGFWNVDDIRTAEGLVDAHTKIQAGCSVIYAPLVEDVQQVWYGIPDRRYEKRAPLVPFSKERFMCEPLGGTFFMFTPQIFAQVGGFDPRFKVLGDFEWWTRAAQHTAFCPGDVIAGYWIKHGDNLTSGGRGDIERNVIYLLTGQFEYLNYSYDPQAMAAVWAEWAEDAPDVPADVADALWGEQARARWQAGGFQRQVQRWLDFPKAMLRLFINYTRLRPIFYRLGLVKDRLP